MNSWTANISGGGACVHLQPSFLGKFSEGQHLKIRIEKPHTDYIETHAVIVRIRENCKMIHVEFDGIREGKRDQLIKFLRNYKDTSEQYAASQIQA